MLTVANQEISNSEKIDIIDPNVFQTINYILELIRRLEIQQSASPALIECICVFLTSNRSTLKHPYHKLPDSPTQSPFLSSAQTLITSGMSHGNSFASTLKAVYNNKMGGQLTQPISDLPPPVPEKSVTLSIVSCPQITILASQTHQTPDINASSAIFNDKRNTEILLSADDIDYKTIDYLTTKLNTSLDSQQIRCHRFLEYILITYTCQDSHTRAMINEKPAQPAPENLHAASFLQGQVGYGSSIDLTDKLKVIHPALDPEFDIGGEIVNAVNVLTSTVNTSVAFGTVKFAAMGVSSMNAAANSMSAIGNLHLVKHFTDGLTPLGRKDAPLPVPDQASNQIE